jgi:tRNA A-37 threonylcarbamoyl transferase component Bud32/tetratricopeptide (TPR) repeat protein
VKAATAQLLGQQIGRIRVIDVLGEGGMGEVYVGFDDTLQRKVAVKVIRSEFRLQEEAKARFLREARILSRLDHPQVCTVYDFLEGDDCDFLVLELVDGRNLREAMESGLERDGCLSIARQLLEVLDAVHEEGVVHRDLKPENVMVASSGAITVLDFGLARSQEHEIAVDSSLPTLSPATSDSSPPAQRPSGSGRSVYVKTRLGSVMGTAGYMSPEQARGESATAASDMYATGLMLREMFTGVAPFTAAEEPTKILDGARTTPAQQTVDEVPGLPGLASLIRDLLRVEPVDRPSAKVALERLQWASAAPERRRAARRRLIAAVAGVVVIVAAIAGGLVLERHRRRCSGAEQRMEEVWSPSRRASVRSAVLASNPAARGTWAAVERLLDSYALAWQTSRLEACEATLVHGEQPVEIMNLRMACLDGCLAELDALVEVLNEDPATVLWRAVAATHALTAVDSCSDLQRLSPFMSDPDDPEAQEAADTLEAALARVKALHDAGRWADGLAELDAIQPELDALGWPRLSGEALYLRARCLERLGQIDDADQVLRETTWQSVSHRLDRVAANAWVRRVWVNGVLRSEFERAHELTGHAHAAIARLGGDPELEADLANHEGVVAARSGDMETALAHLQTALQIRRDLYGDDHPRVASTLNNVALVLEELGRLEESIRTSREVLEIRIRALGPDHP